MTSAEQHQIEQDAITAMCEAGICDHPECQEKQATGWQPESHWDDHPGYPSADWVNEVQNAETRLSYVEWVNARIAAEYEEETADYMNELVDRAAPRWAWDIIDETLAMDGQSKAFDASLRNDIKAATLAMERACDHCDDPISRAEIDAIDGGEHD